MNVQPYDALLVVSFGGPEHADDVIPFLSNVTAGRNIPQGRLTEVGQHYFEFGGRSPINEQCRLLIQALREDFDRTQIDLPIYWGNRNWHPFLSDTLAAMEADGISRAICFITSAYASYSGCRQYREDLYAASEATTVKLDRLRHGFNHPGFLQPFVDGIRLAAVKAPDAHIVFVTHSIPSQMNAASGGPDQGAYVRQHLDAAATIAHDVGAQNWSLAYCSRSGSGRTPWLEPDINAHLQALAHTGVNSVIAVPLGFVSDHMEVIYDLDIEAASTAKDLNMTFERVGTPGTHPRFIEMIANLVTERAAVERGESVGRECRGLLGPHQDTCPADCCLHSRALPTIS